MKKRLGFVSNSSSSSFIIGIAKVTDEKKLREYISSKGIDLGGYDGIHIDTIENLKGRWEFTVKDNKITLESFMTDVRTEFASENDKIVYYDFTGGDDSDFWDGDYYDYDIDLDFFDSNEIDAFNLFFQKNIGIDNGDATYGAGRNG